MQTVSCSAECVKKPEKMGFPGKLRLTFLHFKANGMVIAREKVIKNQKF